MPKRQYNMSREPRLHRCSCCGLTMYINTNHTAGCYDHCRGCSWKGVTDEDGELQLPGFRFFRYFDPIGDMKQAALSRYSKDNPPKSRKKRRLLEID